MADRNTWLRELSTLSANVARIVGLATWPIVDYRDQATKNIVFEEAFNFCQDLPHNQAIARCLDALSATGTPDSGIEKYLRDLTSGRLTYGTLSELLVYHWLQEHGAKFDAQVKLSGVDILNPSGSDLDGKLTGGTKVYFDVKAFGFQEMMISRLTDRLQKDFSGFSISIEGSWDVSAEDLQDLLESRGYNSLLTDLTSGNTASRGLLKFVRRPIAPVLVSSRSVNPYGAAEEHASYVFRFAKQFVRNDPFILFFAHHPWLGGLTLSANFADYNSIYMRSLARRTFMQHLGDTTLMYGLMKGDVSRLVAAIGFLNISHIPHGGGGPGPKDARLSIYINPNAKNALPRLALKHITWNHPHAIQEDDFHFDNY